ncbi:hypothetical protein Poly51_31610 [Rubripirellula tenax]|uniref:Uncharacterized protein n=1 Tax=Rubripirellula tenax TaxID=2528015 RepID=A0A5C6EZE5_9BACT|nr:hypothetical protein [Rubripirellula tenax]TWU54442.1 hypothetical protein Poly51_31610 [Rubripirellula tenax]
MISDDLEELYKLLRGSRSANAVLDARALIQENKAVLAFAKLVDARESYMESRSRLLKQVPEEQFKGTSKEDVRNRKVLLRKQEKTHEILKAFEEVMPLVERVAKREEAAAAAEAVSVTVDEIEDEDDEPELVVSPADPSIDDDDAPADDEAVDEPDAPIPSRLATSADITQRFVEAFNDHDDDGQLDLVNDEFGFREVNSDDDIYPSAVYLIRLNEKNFLVRTALTAASDRTIELESVTDERVIKPFSREDFFALGKRHRMVLLTKSLIVEDSSSFDDDDDDENGEQHVLDMAAFGQLLTAAQRSGLVSGADQIGHVRDREFRMEKYDLAYQAIDAIFSRFTADASQRAQQLVREDNDISAGRLKISPKDLQAKRIRDRMQTQEVERARRRFQVVLEGLRVLGSGVS